MRPTPLNTRIQWPLAALLLLSALVLGGGQGTPGDSLCQVLALVLIAVSLGRHWQGDDGRLPRLAWLALVPLALPLLQLLPIPDGLWQSAPARAELAAQLASVGADHAGRVSVVPAYTEQAMFWLLPGVALFLAGLQFRPRQRYALVGVVLVVVLAGTVLGFMQRAGGVDSHLQLYTITNYGNAVGFFANSNHNATFMAMGLPLVLVATAAWVNRRVADDEGQWLPWLVGGTLVVLLILGIAVARSRAGMLLGMLALLLSTPAVLALRSERGTRRALIAAVVVGVAFSVQFAMFGIVQRIEQGLVDNDRLHYAAKTRELATNYAPLGTGLGGFRRAYEGFDREPPLDGVYINHAHNDPAELWLEGGWPALLLVLPLLGLFVYAGWRVWRGGDTTPERLALRRAAWIAMLLVLLHSFGDYPLRTTAHLALFGMLAAFLTVAPGHRRRSESPAGLATT